MLTNSTPNIDTIYKERNRLKQEQTQVQLNHKIKLQEKERKLEIEKDSAIYTSGALEQLSGKIYDFINFTLSKKPKIVIHVEPAPQFYDTNKLVDFTADFFQRKRGYTDNLLDYLMILEKKNKIKIIKKIKSPFGSLMIEGYNFIAWRPK